MTASPITPLPPGSTGLPLLGETLDFVKDGFGFVQRRHEAHGPIFKTSILGRDTVVLSGPEAVGVFIDADRIERDGAMPPHIQELFGGRSLPLLDGPVHFARKTMVLSAFSRSALASYLPVIQRIVETYAERWAATPEIRWLDEMKKLALEAICTNVIGIDDPAELEQLRRDYMTMTASFASLPIRLPGTKYSKALAARERIFAVFKRQVAARRAAPTDDGLSRMLAMAAKETTPTGDTEIVLEVHHAVIAGFIVFAEFATSILELTRAPQVLARLKEEVRANAGSGPLSPEQLMGMPYLTRVVMETKRLTPIIPAVFGKAKRTFEWHGVTVPQGWMVMWDVRGSNADPATYTDPRRFDPDRFATGREEHKRHEHAFTPQGSGPPTGHKCPGIDYATFLMSMFLVVLARGYEWTLPQQNLEPDWSVTPPEPKDGLRAVVRKARS